MGLSCCLPAWLETTLLLLGGIGAMRALLSLASFVSRTFLRSAKSFAPYGAGAGYWAVVTGASDGIGRAYALALAAKGFNVALVSRTQSKLDAVEKEIAALSGGKKVRTMTVAIDLAHAGDADWARLDAALTTMGSVGVLVNNAGMSSEYPERFLDADAQRHRDIVAVNVAAFTEVAQRVMAVMVRNAHQGKRGLVLNISSLSAAPVVTPMLAVYAASKAYVMAFSTALAAEYASRNVDVECHAPAFVVSKMSKRRRATWNCPMPEQYVRASLAKVGRGDWIAFSPYWAHGLMEYIMDVAPLPLRLKIQKNGDMHADIRRRYLAKQARDNAGAASGSGSSGKSKR